MMCASKVEDRAKISFKGNKWENPIEFLHKCEREMATIGSNLNDRDRIEFVSRHFQETASKWYTIVQDQTETYEQFKASFENRYWNIPVSYTHLDVYKRQWETCRKLNELLTKE